MSQLIKAIDRGFREMYANMAKDLRPFVKKPKKAKKAKKAAKRAKRR